MGVLIGLVGWEAQVPLGETTGCEGGLNQPLTRSGSVMRARPRRAYQKEAPKM